MSVSEQAGRANRPDIKEIVSHTDDLKELLESKLAAQREIMDERDRRYEDRFKGTEERTNLALNASDKAVSKAEAATEKRFEGVNEMRSSLNDMTNNLLTKDEAKARFDGFDLTIGEMKGDIISLREFRSAGGGKEIASAVAQDQRQFDVRTLLSVAAIFLSLLSTLVAVVLFIWKQHS